MKKAMLFLSLTIFYCPLAFAQSNADFNGRKVREIKIETARISPGIVRKKFSVKEGDIFFGDNYDTARQALHDMRVFKSIDFKVLPNDDETVSIEINANDGYYIFPIVFGTGGSKSTIAASIVEANLFKSGEMLFLFGVYSSDGFMTMAGLGVENNFFNIQFSGMNFKEFVYKNGSYNASGMFTSEPDQSQTGKPEREYRVKDKSFRFAWSRSFNERASVTAGFSMSDISYSGAVIPSDKGRHNKIVLGLKSYKGIKPGGGGASFGAIFGIGLSDVADKLADLPKRKPGYFAGIQYENGGNYTGSDFDISKINLKLAGKMEFRKRHILFLDIAAAKDFNAPFYDSIKSVDVLSGKGIYSREFRGNEAAGAGISFIWHPVKSKTGVLSLAPFIEHAAIWKDGSLKSHGGAGASISYQIWRVPFPLGINYTQNLTDGSRDISLLFGGWF